MKQVLSGSSRRINFSIFICKSTPPNVLGQIGHEICNKIKQAIIIYDVRFIQCFGSPATPWRIACYQTTSSLDLCFLLLEYHRFRAGYLHCLCLGGILLWHLSLLWFASLSCCPRMMSSSSVSWTQHALSWLWMKICLRWALWWLK